MATIEQGPVVLQKKIADLSENKAADIEQLELYAAALS
jgi:hypothetical protein